MSTQFSLPPRNEQTSFGSASFPPLSGTARSTVGMLDANPDHDNFEMGDASGRPGTPPTSGLPFGSQVLGNPFGSIDDSFMAPPATHMQSFAGVTIVPSASYSSNADSIGTAAFGTSSSQAPLGTAAFGTSNLGSGPIAESELEQPGSAVLPYRSMPPVQTEKQPVAMVSQAKLAGEGEQATAFSLRKRGCEEPGDRRHEAGGAGYPEWKLGDATRLGPWAAADLRRC